MGEMLSGSIPQAYSVQSGAPEPPEKRDHWYEHGEISRLHHIQLKEG